MVFLDGLWFVILNIVIDLKERFMIMKLSTRDIVYIGFIAALCAVATTIRIEIPGGAMVH